MISDDQMRSMLYAITHHDTSRPLKLYRQIISLDSLLYKSNKRIENLERQLAAYKRYIIKKSIESIESNVALVPGNDFTVDIVLMLRVNKNLFDNELFDLERCLIKQSIFSIQRFLINQATASIKRFLNDPNTKKRMQELRGD